MNLLPRRPDARDRPGLAVDHGLGALDDVEELDARRLHPRVREPVERVDEAPRGDGLAVREPEARLDREGVRLAVARDDREALGDLGGGDGAGGAFLVLPVHQLARRRGLELPRLPVVGELRVDVVDVGRDLHHDRAAALGGRRGRGDRGGEQREARDRQHDPEQSLGRHCAPFLEVGRWNRPPAHREPRGSNASRRPSPSRLKASVVKSSASPGHTMRSGREV